MKAIVRKSPKRRGVSEFRVLWAVISASADGSPGTVGAVG